MRAVGYRQVWNYLAGEGSYSEMRERAIISSRQLAKRQLTWLRADRDVQWLDETEGIWHDWITETKDLLAAPFTGEQGHNQPRGKQDRDDAGRGHEPERPATGGRRRLA